MPPPEASPGTVDELAFDYARIVLEHSPVEGTGLGLHERDHELPPVSAEALDAYAAALRGLRRRTRQLATPEGGEADLDRRGLLAHLEHALFSLEVDRPYARNPVAWAQQAGSAVLLPMLRTYLPARHRERAVTARAAAVPEFLDAARDLLEPGDVPPLWARLGQASARSGAGLFRVQVPEAFPAAAEAGARAATALEAFADWVAAEVEPAARGSFAAGERCLAHLLRACHLLAESPAEVRARGLALVERCEAALRDTAGRADWKAALAEAKADHPAADGLIDAYRAEVERLRAYCFAHDLVSDSGAATVVNATPEFLRPVMGFAAYLPPGPFDAERSGEVWVTPPADAEGLADHSYAAIAPVSAHEGYPGHHLQMTSVGALPSPVRRLPISALMIEGWGLYVEELMAEVGYYTVAARLVQLSLGQLRAARIVVDMALHTGDMEAGEAIDYLVERTGLTRTIATSEVARYTMMPTQPFSYLTGAEEIRRIRAAWMRRNDGASLREFHDALLSYGHLPPALAAEGLLG